MRTMQVDVAIVGAGTAGLGAQREVEKAKRSHVLIEAGSYGTTCARVGCMPSKLLIAAADSAHELARAPTFGVHAAGVRVDGAEVMARVQRERDRFVAGVVRMTERIPAESRVRGRARFVDRTTLMVDDAVRVEARAIVVATGSRPWIPPPFDALPESVVTSDAIFEWTDLPRSVAVVGTGIIGLELGQALGRLGVEVAFFSPPRELGPFTDPELRASAAAIFDDELELHLGIEDIEATLEPDGARIAWTEDGARSARTFERVLVAAGRRTDLAAMDFEATGLPLDARGRPPWNPRTTQCGDAPIFLAGDASGHRPLLHEASDEGHIAGANASTYPEVTAHVRRTELAIAFTDPQIALVGCTHEELGDEAEIGEASFEEQGRARVMAQNRGKVRLYALRGSCRLVGAEMLGPGVEHLAHLVAWAVQQGMTVQDCLSMPFYHPVIEEGLRRGLRDLAKSLAIEAACRGEDTADCPGQ